MQTALQLSRRPQLVSIRHAQLTLLGQLLLEVLWQAVCGPCLWWPHLACKIFPREPSLASTCTSGCDELLEGGAGTKCCLLLTVGPPVLASFQ